jgi:transcription initiation factor IIE alpha subunit
MAIIETKVDEFMNLIYEKKQITSNEAAKILEVDESYIRKLAYLFQKRKVIDLKTSLTSLTIVLVENH